MSHPSPAHLRADVADVSPKLRVDMIRRLWVPIGRDQGVRVVAAAAPDAELAAEVSRALAEPVRLTAAPRQVIVDAVLEGFAGPFAAEAVDALHDRDPERSARSVLVRGQKIAGALLILVLLGLLIAFPRQTILALLFLCSVLFLAGTAFKFVVSLRGARVDVVQRISTESLDELDDETLPRYTVLVPVFREANIVARLVDNLGALDWPADRLEILVLVEAEDDETRTAIEGAEPPANVTIVTVPPGTPQTKPRACNLGLAIATGDYLVIYDAEDVPEPDQLKKAYLAFRRGGEEVVCVQAALNYFNAQENLLTRMFTLEYSYWFDYMLPGLDLDRLPIPLGGTSNHFRVEALRELGGWDPHNVTEDADLGIRASARGQRVGIVESTTFEEANTSVPNFIRQRSRWIKGYMQTALVHARHPLQLIRAIGLRSFLGFTLLIAGTPFVFLAMLPFTLATIASVFVPVTLLEQWFPLWVLWPALMNFLIGNVLMVYLNMMGPYRRGAFNLVLWALLNPVYWLLHSIAAYKALWQLIVRPHYWEKTEHGLSDHEPIDADSVEAQQASIGER
ncbi:glycosyltransferase [Naumannella halotolerans]|uniref:glycosyltransferase n=1 Tax=Naumannella halotolerans TaxID=993414 RepID=UPI00370D3555